jgi:hypothetical protein
MYGRVLLLQLSMSKSRPVPRPIPLGSIASKRSGMDVDITVYRLISSQSSSAEIVCWVSVSARPFAIVEDEGFKTLMKTGRPELWIPSKSTVARDVHRVFIRCRARIAKQLQVSVYAYRTANSDLPPGI